MSQPRLICRVTIHGIGFQQAPGDPDLNDGYADNLHTALLDEFSGGELANGPNRLARGIKGAVDVHSCWPPRCDQTEAGISRLGTWSLKGAIDMASAPKKAPLRPDGSTARFAHVALVDSPLEGTQGDPNTLLGIGVLGASSRAQCDFMDWGTDARDLSLTSREWTSFYDDIDPAADPLGPTTDGKRGRDDLPADGGSGMLVCYEPGCDGPTSQPAAVEPVAAST